MSLRNSFVATFASALLYVFTHTAIAAGAKETFTNPVLPSGADPWVAQRDRWYYYTNTLGDRIALWKTRDMARLSEASPVTVWRAPKNGPNSTAVWAPELHYLRGKWYLYYSAADRLHDDDAHRHSFVLENASDDPTRGSWVDRGMLQTDHSGIDGTVFELPGKLYFVYSAYIGDHSDLIIAPMRNPWTLSKAQVDIAHPTHGWEMQGGRRILEGPEFIQGPSGKLFLTYSASACWSDGYALGLLTANPGADPTNPASWTKSAQPALAQSPENSVYAPGHNGFFKSPDGREEWIIYHANPAAGMKCTSRRAPHIQPFHWRGDGTPDFGVPVKTGAPIAAPSR